MKANTKYALKSKCPRPLWKAMTAFYRRLLWLRYRSDMKKHPEEMTMYCPCCGFRLRNFHEGEYRQLPEFYEPSLFEGIRQDVQCPVCDSLPRHRILAMWCGSNKDLLTSKDILYFAPERCMTGWMDRNHIRYKTADLNNPDTDMRLDIQATGLADGSYDVVICNHVLEHVGDYNRALAEVRRILRPGGIFICSFPVSRDVDEVLEDPDAKSEADRLRLYGQSDHVRLFGINADKILEQAGLDVTAIDGADYPDEILPVTGPGKYDINRLYVCRKG
ncbi:MAG: methyltransferase domain-containing protein [Clostridiales bacterium]|nr:methyltransferase domain-containing protein [Clostridiales bacterium]